MIIQSNTSVLSIMSLRACKDYINVLPLDKYYTLDKIPASIIGEFMHLSKHHKWVGNRKIELNESTEVFRVIKRKIPISKYFGVYKKSYSDKFTAQIWNKQTNVYLGLFNNEHIANIVCQLALSKLT